MPARHISTTDIPSDVLISLARDPDQFEKGIRRWQEAETTAKREQRRLAEVEKKALTATAALEALKAAHEERVAERERVFAIRQEALDQRETKINQHAARDTEARQVLKADREELENATKQLQEGERRLSDREVELDNRAEKLKADEIALAAVETLMKEREARHKAQWVELQERLKGFAW